MPSVQAPLAAEGHGVQHKPPTAGAPQLVLPVPALPHYFAGLHWLGLSLPLPWRCYRQYLRMGLVAHRGGVYQLGQFDIMLPLECLT